MKEKRILAQSTSQLYETIYDNFRVFVHENHYRGKRLSEFSLYKQILSFLLHCRNVDKRRKKTLVKYKSAIYYYLNDKINFRSNEEKQLNTIILNADEQNPPDITMTKEAFTQKQSIQILQYLMTCVDDTEMSLIVDLILATGGSRISEIMNLRVQDVKITKEDVIVTTVKSKTEKNPIKRGIKANANNIGLRLQRHIDRSNLKNDDYIFKKNRKKRKLVCIDMCKNFKKYLAQMNGKFEDFNIDLRFYSLHSLRATFVTNSQEKKHDTYRSMRMSGHKSQQVYDGYDKLIVRQAEDPYMYDICTFIDNEQKMPKREGNIIRVNFGQKRNQIGDL